MELKDNTAETNKNGTDGLVYIHHRQSVGGRHAIAIELVQDDHYNVVAMMREPGWPDFGVLRYWGYEDRQMAEAQYLLLQGLLAPLDEAVAMKELLAILPAPERVERPERVEPDLEPLVEDSE